ncbi:MAG: hypothetical protein U0670_07045 [Anaerolineae bacterium]
MRPVGPNVDQEQKAVVVWPWLAQWVNSPIARVEYRSQKRLVRGRIRLMRAMMFALLGFSILLTLLRPLMMGNPQWFNAPLSVVIRIWDGMSSIVNAALLLLNANYYFWIVSLAAQAGTQSIVREKQSRTWEMLLLTGVDTRHLIMGKWAATLRTIYEAQRPLFIPHLLIVIWGIIVSVLIPGGFSSGFTSGVSGGPALFAVLPLVVFLSAVIYPAFGVAASAALGVFGSLFGSTESTARLVTVALQIAVITLVGILIVLSIPAARSTNGMALFIPLIISPFDGGITMMGALQFMSVEVNDLRLFGLLLPPSLAYVALNGLGAWVLLIAARRLARWQNISKPDKRM